MSGARCCCAGACCQCWKGPQGDAGGCCYRLGDVLRLTFPRPAFDTVAMFSNAMSCSGAPFTASCDGASCPPEITYPKRCCYTIECSDQPDLWVEYECTATPCDGLVVYRTNPDDGFCYCHPYYQFTLNGNSNFPPGTPTACNYPLEIRWVCAGCRVIEDVCATPSDWRPDSVEPCRFVDALGSPFYLPAATAPGWEWTCAGTCPGDVDNGPCINCIGSTACTCTNQAGLGWQNPCECSSEPCEGEDPGVCIFPCTVEYDANGYPTTNANCVVLSPFIPGCVPTSTFYLTDCDGLVKCCYRYRVVNQSTDCCVEDYVCEFDGISVITLERKQDFNCVWDDAPAYGCRARVASDPADPGPDLPDCPLTPAAGDAPRGECVP
jgi:hypothetical protein